MKTTNDLAPLHKTGFLEVRPLVFLVKILDTRHVWGRTDFLVSPIHGRGQQWVSEERLTLAPENPA